MAGEKVSPEGYQKQADFNKNEAVIEAARRDLEWRDPNLDISTGPELVGPIDMTAPENIALVDSIIAAEALRPSGADFRKARDAEELRVRQANPSTRVPSFARPDGLLSLDTEQGKVINARIQELQVAEKIRADALIADRSEAEQKAREWTARNRPEDSPAAKEARAEERRLLREEANREVETAIREGTVELNRLKSSILEAERAERHILFYRGQRMPRPQVDLLRAQFQQLEAVNNRNIATLAAVREMDLEKRANLEPKVWESIMANAQKLLHDHEVERRDEAVDMERQTWFHRRLDDLKRHPVLRLSLSLLLGAGTLALSANGVIPLSAGILAIGAHATGLGLAGAGSVEAVHEMVRNLRHEFLSLYGQGADQRIITMQTEAEVAEALAAMEEKTTRTGTFVGDSGYKKPIEAAREKMDNYSLVTYRRLVDGGMPPFDAILAATDASCAMQITEAANAIPEQNQMRNQGLVAAAAAGGLVFLGTAAIEGVQYAQMATQGVEVGQASLSPEAVSSFNVTESVNHPTYQTAQHSIIEFSERFGLQMDQGQINRTTNAMMEEMSATGPGHTLLDGHTMQINGEFIWRIIQSAGGAG